MWRRGGLLVLLCLAWSVPAQAQFRTGWHERLSKSFQLTVYSSTIDQPILREPGGDSGGRELPVDQSRKVTGGKLSWMYAGRKFGVDLGLALWNTGVEDFTLRRNEFRDTTHYSDGSVRYIFFDTGVDWAPFPVVPLAVYGVFGMGSETEKYTTRGSDPGGNMFGFYGDKSNTAFQYSFGGGLRFYPLHNLALTGEARWIPGDLVSEVSSGSITCYYGSYGGTSWSNCEGGGKTENFTRVVSLGAMVIFP